jgi:large subunit ribosomal protein L13
VNTLSYKTVSANKATVQKEWYVVDAKDEVLGRLASKVAMVLRGKHKPSFTPHVDCGDYVIVINAEKVKLTGNKLTEKQYLRHSGYPGGQRTQTPEDLLSKKPGCCGESHQGYASQKQAWKRDVQESACVCRRKSSA